MFEPFTREKNTTKSGVLGSGLGMAVVRSLVDLMDGRIDVKSKQGEGSKFTVTIVLKYLEKDIGALSAAPSEPISLKGRRLLLVEDNDVSVGGKGYYRNAGAFLVVQTSYSSGSLITVHTRHLKYPPLKRGISACKKIITK